ncbi:MAG: hypothetical protein WBM28_17550 [Burkholderiales bacterium]
MAEPTLYGEIVKAAPVVIGGLLAILGGVAGQIITHRLTAARERSAVIRERIESLVKALYGHTQWLEEKRVTMLFRDGDHDSPSPLEEARMLQSLYFPELAAEIIAIQQAQIPMMEFVGQQRVARMKDRKAWMESFSQAPYLEMYKAHLLAHNAAISKCRTLINVHLKS